MKLDAGLVGDFSSSAAFTRETLIGGDAVDEVDYHLPTQQRAATSSCW